MPWLATVLTEVIIMKLSMHTGSEGKATVNSRKRRNAASLVLISHDLTEMLQESMLSSIQFSVPESGPVVVLCRCGVWEPESAVRPPGDATARLSIMGPHCCPLPLLSEACLQF